MNRNNNYKFQNQLNSLFKILLFLFFTFIKYFYKIIVKILNFMMSKSELICQSIDCIVYGTEKA
jgi:hypothetical protein